MKLPLADWKCSDKERKYINEVLDSGCLTYGPWQKRLEHMWSSYHNCLYGVINSSGTSALQLAFRACKELYKWDSKSEVICPGITFPATINMVYESGLRPRLCDVDISDGMIDCKHLEAQINKNTKAVCIVHLWGTPYPRKHELIKLCNKHNLHIIEDSCETISREVGNWGDVSCFSMYFNHIISAGVGGMACTNNPNLENLMRSLANHGMTDPFMQPVYDRFHFSRIGYSSRITEMEAALAVAQFERVDDILAYRTSIRDILTESLEAKRFEDLDIIGGTMLYPVLTNMTNRELMRKLFSMGIETRAALPITNYKPFIDIGRNLPVCEEFNERGILLPIHPMMTRKHCEYISNSLMGILNK